ncbi:MAG: hypothetical protein HY023_10905 [Chloroflexi bacterium]|nr:hypothetical protein [Chloroflexota bacterium]
MMALSTPLSDDDVTAVVNLPEVADAEGWITANVRWKPRLEDEWHDARRRSA